MKMENTMYSVINNAPNVSSACFSFYIHNKDYRTTSFMKYGGYDWAGFASSADNQGFWTMSSTSWAITAPYYQLIKHTASG